MPKKLRLVAAAWVIVVGGILAAATPVMQVSPWLWLTLSLVVALSGFGWIWWLWNAMRTEWEQRGWQW